MIKYFVDCTGDIPEAKETLTFQKNAWVSPSGDFYGFKGAKHLLVATWIAIFKLGATEKSLKHGQFFNDSWDTFLLRQGWISINNLSWLDQRDQPSTFKSREILTEKQKSTIFDYCEAFGYDYEKLVTEM